MDLNHLSEEQKELVRNYLEKEKFISESIKNILKANGKSPKTVVCEKWDNQFEFANPQRNFRREELLRIIKEYCGLNSMTFVEIEDVMEEIKKYYITYGVIVKLSEAKEE